MAGEFPSKRRAAGAIPRQHATEYIGRYDLANEFAGFAGIGKGGRK
jgi:hypothetical protein